jgi:signal recognition particle receptor subunit beta
LVLINSTTMQAMAKIVYYGPGLCGKTTNLQHIHAKTAPSSRGEMLSLETETDRTLFFDLLPLEVGTVGGMKVRLQLYTVPGQVFYNATRKIVLKNADGIVFVADSQEDALEANVESFSNLRANLAEVGMSLDDVPMVLQYNKRDLQQLVPVEILQRELNRAEVPYFEASARFGLGVFETLKGISRLTLKAVRDRVTTQPTEKPEAAKPSAPAEQPPAPQQPQPERVSGVKWMPAARKGDGQTQPMQALKDVDFAEENTGKYAVRAVLTRGVGALHEQIEKVRSGQVELQQHATVEVPAGVLRAASKLGVHLSFQGDGVTLKDATTITLGPDDAKGRVRLRLDLEIEPLEAEEKD